MIGIFGWIVVGLLAGWIASLVMNRHHGLVVNLIIGLIGALIGGWLAGLVHFNAENGWVSSFVIAFGGALVLLFVLGLFRRRSAS